MRLIAIALVGLACTLVPGCSIFMRSMERPEVAVRDVSMSSAGSLLSGGITGQLKLDVTNPNDFGVPLAGIDWQLSIGGARAVTGKVQLSQTIPARGVAPILTSLTIDLRDALAVSSALAGGARDYQIAAKLHFSTGIGRLDVDVQHTGQLGSGALGAR
jgi:LEA14-like dessication related protein